MRGLRNLSAAIWLGAVAGGGMASAATVDEAVGQAMAAVQIAEGCRGVGLIGGGGYQPFVMAATELLAQQGFGKQRMRAILFYGKTEMLQAAGVRTLQQRGVTPAGSCGFGRQMAGTQDAIGRFMVKGD